MTKAEKKERACKILAEMKHADPVGFDAVTTDKQKAMVEGYESATGYNSDVERRRSQTQTAKAKAGYNRLRARIGGMIH